jgi:hypothetical protein
VPREIHVQLIIEINSSISYFARNAEAEKQPLQANGFETTFISRQTAAKQTTERRPLLGSRFLISRKGSVNTFPRQRIPMRE